MNNPSKVKLSTIVVPYIYKYLLLAITATCRLKIHGKQYINDSEKARILSIWHNNAPIGPWFLQNQKVAVMVSESKDGELLSRIIQIFGNTTIRGSTSKGSAKATRQALKALKQGTSVVITPDGPRGPKYTLQNGVLWLAALSKISIIPCHSECSRQFEFNSWDKQKVPKPFSTIHVSYAKPVEIDRHDLETDAEKTKAKLEKAMMDNVEYTLSLVGRSL